MTETNGRGEGKIARMIQPNDFEGAFAMATRLCLSELIPKGFKPKLKLNMALEERQQAIEVAASSIVIAWEMGAELGLSPMTALQSIAVINGKPNLYGETPLAVVMASGKLEKITEVLDEEKRVQTCTVKRVGIDDPVTKTFSMKEADEAEMYEYDAQGNGKWKKLSERATYRSWWRDMLMYRARGRALKALFADVLKGIEIQEASLETGDPADATPGPGAGVVIEGTSVEVNPFSSTKKAEEAAGDRASGGSTPGDRSSMDSSTGSTERAAGVTRTPDKVDKPKRARKSAAGEQPAASATVDPAPAAETTDPICVNVRLRDGIRCSGPAGHEGECMYDAPAAEGSEDCPTSGCWSPKGHEGDHVFEPDEDGPTNTPEAAGGGKDAAQTISPADAPKSAEAGVEVAGAPGQAATATPDSPAQGADAPLPAFPAGVPAGGAAAAKPAPKGPQKFYVGTTLIETAGMTEVQFRESLMLGTRIDKDPRYMNKAKWPAGYSRELLRRLMGVSDLELASRKHLTEEQGEEYLKRQRAACEPTGPQQEIPKT